MLTHDSGKLTVGSCYPFVRRQGGGVKMILSEIEAEKKNKNPII
jgi:hypothetical protein